MQILLLDIEISPTIVPVWGLFNNHSIPTGNIMGNSEVLSWAAKWHGEDSCEYSSLRMVGHTPAGKRKMLKAIYDMIAKADVVVGYNSNSFDLKILNKEFLLQGWASPGTYKTVDLLRAVKNRFRFTSNKLDYVAQALGLGSKDKHPGMPMWLTCMNKTLKGTPEYESAWDSMEQYNVQDVFLTENLYNRILGWIPNHPSFSAFDNAHVCPNCGGNHLQRRGKALTTSLTYQRWQCKDCGAWSRSKVADKSNRTAQLAAIK